MSIFPTRILLATDGSTEAELAAQTASFLAQSTKSELHVATVGPSVAAGLPLPHVGFPSPKVAASPVAQQELGEEARKLLDTQVERIETNGSTVAQAYLRSGRADAQVVALAEEIDAGMVVVGSRGLGGIRRALLGSVSDSIVCHAPCPVLVVRAGGADDGEPVFSSRRILWATDGSEEAELAGRMAREIAQKSRSELHVIHIGPLARYARTVGGSATLSSAQDALDKEARRLLDAQAKKVETVGGAVAQVHLRSSETPAAQIVALTEEIGAGLVVIGSRGLGRISRALLGSVSDWVVRHAYGSVLVVRKGSKPDQDG